MTRKQVCQYRCDFCKKRNLSAASITKHEKHCTKNPERNCRMCTASGGQQEPIEDLIACIDISLPDEGLSRLRDLAGNCPACILAALLQCGAYRPGFTLMYPPALREMAIGSLPDGFDFKSAAKEWLEEVKEERRENESIAWGGCW